MGVDGFSPYVVSQDWVSYDTSRKAIFMDAAGAGLEKPGAVLFKDNNRVNKVVILCTLVSAE